MRIGRGSPRLRECEAAMRGCVIFHPLSAVQIVLHRKKVEQLQRAQRSRMSLPSKKWNRSRLMALTDQRWSSGGSAGKGSTSRSRVRPLPSLRSSIPPPLPSCSPSAPFSAASGHTHSLLCSAVLSLAHALVSSFAAKPSTWQEPAGPHFSKAIWQPLKGRESNDGMLALSSFGFDLMFGSPIPSYSGAAIATHVPFAKWPKLDQFCAVRTRRCPLVLRRCSHVLSALLQQQPASRTCQQAFLPSDSFPKSRLELLSCGA
jgi:hypothetical protein